MPKAKFFNKKALLFAGRGDHLNSSGASCADEFKELAKAAGLSIRGVMSQNIKAVHPAFYMGEGKVQDIRERITQDPVDVLVCDAMLTGVQTRNLEKELRVAIVDRNQLILDIFAGRAKTYEGKLQVELACALDELPRMVGAWHSSLSRQGGGIGAKGPGEKAIEVDRREIKKRVKKIRSRLEKVQRARLQSRSLRQRRNIPSVALIGYTNSGKSTLFNSLGSGGGKALVKNLPFMTLDPMTQNMYIPGFREVVVTDTVGFIQNLSPHLVEAFKATLEESAVSDLLLHVIDVSSPFMALQQKVVEQLLKSLKWDHKPVIHVYNKMDLLQNPKADMMKGDGYPRVFISALNGHGLDQLKALISRVLLDQLTEEVEFYFLKKDEDFIFELSRVAFIQVKESSRYGTFLKCKMPPGHLKKWEPFLLKSS